MSFCTLADIKDRIGEDGTDYDDVLNAIIASVAAQFETYCNRPLIVTAADETECYSGGTVFLKLSRYPVVDITSIKISYDYEFDAVTALTENSDFRILGGGKKGIILRCLGTWPESHDSIQVVYRGGFCAAGVTPTGNEVALPADLREAGIEQSLYLYKRKSADIGLSGQTFEDGGFQKHETGSIITSARETLDRYMNVD